MPPRTANSPRSCACSTRASRRERARSASLSAPGSSPTRRRIVAGCVPAGGIPSAHPAPRRRRGRRLRGLRAPGALADEVRRRLEPALPADAARGEQADVLLPEEPARGLGGISRVGVVREGRRRAGRRAPGRARRGRAAGAAPRRAQASGASTKARRRSLSASSRREDVKCRLVHDERRNRAFRGRHGSRGATCAPWRESSSIGFTAQARRVVRARRMRRRTSWRGAPARAYLAALPRERLPHRVRAHRRRALRAGQSGRVGPAAQNG